MAINATRIPNPDSSEPCQNYQKLTVSVEEVAVMLGVGLSTVYEHLNRGVIPHKRVGRRYIIFRDAVLREFGLQEQPAQTSDPREAERQAILSQMKVLQQRLEALM
jgi:excisionase family DNA binding protein